MNKFKCIEDKVNSGILRRSPKKVDGLTKDKIYFGALAAIGDGGFLEIAIYNDNKEWESYDPELFVPGEE